LGVLAGVKGIKLFFNKLLSARLMPILLIAALLPALFVIASFWRKFDTLKELKKELFYQEKQIRHLEARVAEEANYIKKIRFADFDLLKKELSSILLLKTERKATDANEKIEEANTHLNEAKSALQLVEKSRSKNPPFLEIEFSLKHPVEVDRDNLCQILKCIEQLEQSPCFFKEFELRKKTVSNEREFYLVNFVLIQREIS